MNERLEEVTELVKESDEKIEVAKTHGVKASQNFEKAHQVIENARESLKVRYSRPMVEKRKVVNLKITMWVFVIKFFAASPKAPKQPRQRSSEPCQRPGQEIW